ncbi:MAG TPA: hypothetical protein VJM50_05285 [Pyrinomonadaceae bacterium]|nr:hypothetical protein [Pyrinomonadaceae bacterium]
MNKLREDLSIGLLGAAAGLFSSSVLLLIDRIDAYYAYLASLGETDQSCYTDFVRELWWIVPTFWHVLLSIVAACLVHRYLKNRLKSPFLLWQVVGITAMLGWVLTVFVGFSLECLMRGNLNSLAYAVTSEKLADLAKYASAVFACNVVYGSVINAASRQYEEQVDLI